MNIRNIYLVGVSLCGLNAYAGTIDVTLGSADAYGVLAGSTATNTGPTIVTGDVGVSPGSAITGFPPGSVVGTIGAPAGQAQTDLTTAYNVAAGIVGGTSLTGQNLGGLVLTPGVYSFASSAQLTGTVTLDAQGDPNAVFLFQIGSTLTTASGSSVVIVSGGQGDNVFWQVGSSATLGTTTDFQGNILALTSITLNSGADIPCGRALARNGAVTMDSNNVSACEVTSTTTPEPVTGELMGGGLLSLIVGATAYKRRLPKPAA